MLDIRKRLESLIEMLHRVLEMTAGLGAEPRVPDLQQVLMRRGRIMSDIEFTQKELENAGWLETVKGDLQLEHLKARIHGLAQAVADCDRRLEAYLTLRMDDVRHELRGLYHTSRAACAYASQNRPAYR